MEKDLSKRVVVTGLSVVSPIGSGIPELTQNLYSGVSGIRKLDREFVDDLDCQIVAQSRFDAKEHFDKYTYSTLDRTSQLALYTSIEAVKDANLTLTDTLKPRMGIYLGTGMGGANSIDENYERLYKGGAKRFKPFTVLMGMNCQAASAIALHHQITGPNHTYTTACSSSTVAIGEAVRLIRHGYADVMLTGGAESLLTLGTIRAWEALRTMAQEDPEDIGASCKPFSLNRTGLVLGEGSAMLVLESYAHAKARGARIYAEIVGYGTANDSGHITQPSVEGQVPTMLAALNDAQIKPEEIRYINAHGTGTQLNDLIETNSVKQVFGDHAYQLSMSSTKGAHGHLMGAAGALETLITILALREQRLPPTLHLKEVDPQCDLDYVPNTPKSVENFKYAMKNSFAFGGTGASLILKNWEE
jgi:3-oxoacyl-[acyl-carrier-protein] synthase II